MKPLNELSLPERGEEVHSNVRGKISTKHARPHTYKHKHKHKHTISGKRTCVKCFSNHAHVLKNAVKKIYIKT